MNQIELVFFQGLAKASLEIGRIVGEHCVRPQTENASNMVSKESNLTVLLRDGKNLYLAEGLKRLYAVADTLSSSESCFPIKTESCYLEGPGEKPKHIVAPDKDAIIRGEWQRLAEEEKSGTRVSGVPVRPSMVSQLGAEDLSKRLEGRTSHAGGRQDFCG